MAVSFIGGGNRSTQRKPQTSIGQNFKVLQIIVIWGFFFYFLRSMIWTNIIVSRFTVSLISKPNAIKKIIKKSPVQKCYLFIKVVIVNWMLRKQNSFYVYNKKSVLQIISHDHQCLKIVSHPFLRNIVWLSMFNQWNDWWRMIQWKGCRQINLKV